MSDSTALDRLTSALRELAPKTLSPTELSLVKQSLTELTKMVDLAEASRNARLVVAEDGTVGFEKEAVRETEILIEEDGTIGVGTDMTE